MSNTSLSTLRQKLTELRWGSDLWWHLPVRRRGGKRFVRRWATHQGIGDELPDLGIEVRPYQVPVDAFWRYVDDCGYRDLAYWGGGSWPTAVEKWLEHFVSIDLLQPRAGEVLIDIASCHSPFPEILREHYGLETYRQDLIYPDGIEGDRIGGDATAMPLADGFADYLTLHCSFEHFEGDADSRLLREAERVLKPGGRLLILPLYTSSTYSIQSDPATWKERTVRFEDDALVCLARGWSETHGRLYDLEHFRDRVLAHLGDLELVVFTVTNLEAVGHNAYLHQAALFTKPE
jgi:hypothetical protein